MEIPCELLMDEILCRLPVKHLLRCRCVSKGWCSLVDSNEFVKKYNKTMIECNTRGVLFIGDAGELYLADLDSLEDDSASVVELDNPLKTSVSWENIVGNSENGIVYMKNNALTELVLFNPSTRKARKIPIEPSEFQNFLYRFSCGFGYDYVNDDYKVLMIANHYLLDKIEVIMLYSIKANEWKRIDNFSCFGIRDMTRDGISAGGSLYFLAQKNDTDIIIGFDFGLQQFKEVPYPAIETSSSTWSLNSFEGSLSFVIVSHLKSFSHRCVHVWVLNHSRSDNHWSKAFSFELPVGLGLFGILALSKSKKEVLFETNTGEVVWYNFKRKTFQKVKIRGIPTGVRSYLYTESLLQLNEDNLLQNLSQDKYDKQKQRNA